METTGTRKLRDLIANDTTKLSPIQATPEQMQEMASGHEELTCWTVETKESEEFGAIHEYTLERPTNEVVLVGLWANPQRDQTAATLMQLCQDGPVSGIALENRGTDRKPFYVIVPL